VDTIYSKDTFVSIVTRERVRSDRTGHDFSLIVFDLKTLEQNELGKKALWYLLRKRLRSYDDIGWYEKNRLGVLLPETGADTAKKLAAEICCNIIPKKLNARYTVLTYPSHWINDRKEDCRRGASQEAESQHCPMAAWAAAHHKLLTCVPLPHTRMPLWKRAIDILGAAFGLLLLLPVLVLIAAYIKIVSPGPAVFKQKRVGFLGKTFMCLKFRTMRREADTIVHNHYFSKLMSSELPMEKLDNRDSRIIPLGKFLRKAGLDELPQLLNVLAGDMSLIGPRPCIPYEAEQYLLWQMRRFEAVPGLTGLWQVNGKNKTTFNQMMRYDISYAFKKNFLLDTAILLKTIPAVIRQVVGDRITKKEKNLCDAPPIRSGASRFLDLM